VRLQHPFIRLPFTFDHQRLSEEASQFSQNQWMPHPTGLKGNSAIALISSGGGNNNSFEGEKKVTAQLDQSPYIQQVLGSFGEVLSRSRLMKLDARSEVTLHVDFNYHWFSRVRIHIPVITNPKIIFHCAEQQLHMQAGECWIFDSWRRHNVVNPSNQDRVHLVIDTCGSSRFWNMVEAVADLPVSEIEAQAQYLPFRPNKKPVLRTEKFASSPVMPPGECQALIEDLIKDFKANENNDQTLVSLYVKLLNNFARDWRELWLLHGHRPEAILHYRNLIEHTRKQLHPNIRALTTASNDIGVNPIFVQRVLNAALVPEASLL
jgi:hypothetical protein